jgi:hypothetical protein
LIMAELIPQQFRVATGLALEKADDTIHDAARGLNKQDRLLLRFALKRSWRLGRCAFYMPPLSVVAEESHIGWKSHTSEAIDRLVAKNVLVPLQVFDPKFNGWYAVNHKFEAWSVKAKPQVEIREEQNELLFGDDLKRLLTEVFVESIKDGEKSFLPVQLPEAIRGPVHAPKIPIGDQRSESEGHGPAAQGEPSQALKPASEDSSPPAPASFRGEYPPPGGVPQGEVVRGQSFTADYIAAAVCAPGSFPKKGTGAAAPGAEGVPTKGTTPQNLNSGGAPAAVPKLGTAHALPAPSAKGFPPHPLSKPNSFDETSTRSASSPKSVPKKGITEPSAYPPDAERPAARVGWAEEGRLMERIAQFVAEDPRNENEMLQSGAFWRERVVRAYPAYVEAAVAEGWSLARTGYVFNNSRAAWLNTKIARLADLKSLKVLPKRARPTKQ